MPRSSGPAAWFWMVLHEQGRVLLGGRSLLIVEYPLLPWTGVIALGYAFWSCGPEAAK